MKKLLSICTLLIILIASSLVSDQINAEFDFDDWWTDISGYVDLGIRSELIDQYPFYVNFRENHRRLWLHGHIGGNQRPEISSPSVSVSYYVRVENSDTGEQISDQQTVAVGTPINFNVKEFEDVDIAWNGTGQAIDTPYGRWVDSRRPPTSSERCVSYDYFGTFGGDRFYVPFLVVRPDYSIEHGGTAGLDCDQDGFNCIVTSSGTINSNIIIDSTTGQFYFQKKGGSSSNSRSRRGSFGSRSCDYVNAPMRENRRSGIFTQVVPQQNININLQAVDGANIEPPIVSGPESAFIGDEVEYSITGTHPENEDIRFAKYFNEVSGGFTSYGTPDPDFTASTTKIYNSTGLKEFKARTNGINGSYSDYSNTHQTQINPLPEIDLTAEDDQILVGESTTLSWEAQYADSCSSEDFETDWQTSGTVTVAPSFSKEYEITCLSEFDLGRSVSDRESINVIPAACGNIDIGEGGTITNNPDLLCDTGNLTQGPNENSGYWSWYCGSTQCSAVCPDGQVVSSDTNRCVDGQINANVDVTDWSFDPRIVPDPSSSCVAKWDTDFSHPENTTCKIVSNDGREISVDALSGEHSSDILPRQSYRLICEFAYGETYVQDQTEELECILNPDFSEF